jgi:hypothetical protein
MGMKQNFIVQITNEKHPWFPCLIIVDEVKEWGVQGYITIPTNDEIPNNNAFIRLPKADYETVGAAVIALNNTEP